MSPSTFLIELTSIEQSIQEQLGYTLFLSSNGTFTKKDHILGHKTHPNKLKVTEIIQSILSDHSGINIEIKTRN